VVVKPSAGLSVGIRLSPAPQPSRLRIGLRYPWGTNGQEKLPSGLMRSQFGIRGRAMLGISSGKAETSLGGEIWNTRAWGYPRGLLAAFVPYVPRGMVGLYASMDYGWTTFGETETSDAFTSPLDQVWTLSLGVRGQLDLVHMKVK